MKTQIDVTVPLNRKDETEINFVKHDLGCTMFFINQGSTIYEMTIKKDGKLKICEFYGRKIIFEKDLMEDDDEILD